MAKTRQYTNVEFAKIMDALEEFIIAAPDEEIVADLKARGEDPDAVAQEVRSLLLGAVTQHKKEKLHAAARKHDERLKELKRKKSTIPGTPTERRRLLEQAFGFLTTVQPAAATAQYRIFSGTTDEEVSQQLEQLDQLGVLDKLKEEEEKKG